MLAGGYDFKVGGVTFGPTASLQYTYFQGNNKTENISGSYQYTLNDSFGSYSSTNSYSDKARLSQYNTSSMLSGLGAHAAYTWTPSKRLLVIPQISLNWQHEFLQNRFSQTVSFNDGSSFKYSVGREPILDTLYTGVGVTLEYAKRYNASFFYNTSAGNKYLVSQNIFLSAGIIF
jgi:outer membrane autotransporter protein